MPELDDGERAYLAAYLQVHSPSRADAEASLARVEERLAGGEAVPTVAGIDEPAPVRWWLRPRVVLTVTAVALAATVALLMRLDVSTMLAQEAGREPPAGAAYAGQDTGETAGEAVSRERALGPAKVSVEAAGEDAPNEDAPNEDAPNEGAPDEALDAYAPEPEATPEAAESASARSQRRRSRSDQSATQEPVEAPTADEPAPVADATLHAEIALLRPAQKALRAKDYARALRLLDDHAKSFPRSVLAEERSLGRIQALCGLGRTAEAARSIEQFGRAHPGSPLTGRVQRACPAAEVP
ncbi:MAG: hypothetical protein KDK70_02540 [Myxococcales bacterium]|nr:hypothetical protein [Myxococcales bacterium]